VSCFSGTQTPEKGSLSKVCGKKCALTKTHKNTAGNTHAKTSNVSVSSVPF